MTEEKVPQVGDELMFIDTEGEVTTETIEEVSDFDDLKGRWLVYAQGDEFYVRYEPSDEHWYDESMDEEKDTPAAEDPQPAGE